MTIYADQMFFENFIINYVILYITANFSSAIYKWYRLSIGAAIGALYVILSYIFGFYDFQMIFFKVLLSLIIVFTSFKVAGIKEFFKILLFFYIVTFVIGGASYGFAYFLNLYTVSSNGLIYVSEFPLTAVVISIVGIFVIFKLCVVLIKRKIDINNFLYKIDIEILGKRIETIAFFDSGHNVVEPIGKSPVIILEKNMLKNIIPLNVNALSPPWNTRLRLIPVSTISSERELLKGFRADLVTIYAKKKKYIKDVIIAECEGELSKYGEYHALISKNLL